MILKLIARLQAKIQEARAEYFHEMGVAPEASPAQLVVSLSKCIEHLRELGDSHWADYLREGMDLIAANDARGVTKVLSAFGGMGSINDFSPRSKNRKLHLLLNEVFAVAREVERAMERGKLSD